MDLFKVKDWDKHYEGAKTKNYNNKTTCSMPNKHGLGYRKMVRSKDGVAVFGAWCALLQVLSRHEKPRQGYCTDTGGVHGIPYSFDDLELITDIPAKHFASLFKVAQTIGWVVVTQVKDTTGVVQSPDKDSKYPLNSDSNLDSDFNSAPDGDAAEVWISHKKRRLSGKRLVAFKRLWESFNYKKGRAQAIDAFLDIPELTDKLVEEICLAASAEHSARPDKISRGSTPIFLQGWISGRRWEDEEDNTTRNSTTVHCMSAEDFENGK